MNRKLELQFDELERSKAALLKKLEALDEGLLSKKPDSKSWSVVQVVSHLIKIEEGSMNYMKKKLSYNPPLKSTGWWTALKIWFTKLMMRLPLRYKTTDFLEEATNDVTLEEAGKLWEVTRKQMRNFFDGLTEQQLSAALHKNLLAGRVNVYQQMSFMQVHFDRHLKQIDRVINQLSHPV
jgi:hypothetical protein